jgi:hypothetical protein
MPQTLQAQSNETPDTTQPLTQAVTGNSNTGHSSTTAFVTIGSEESSSQMKTCRWFNYSPMQAANVVISFNWSLSGSLTLTAAAPDTTVANASFRVEYSLNGGVSWTTALTRSYTQTTNGTQPIGDSGSVSLPIGSSGNTGVIQIRDRIRADASSTTDPTVSASANITASIDSIQLSVDPLGQVIIIM